MRFTNNGIANLFMGCIIGYGVSEAFNFGMESGVLVVLAVTALVCLIYCYTLF